MRRNRTLKNGLLEPITMREPIRMVRVTVALRCGHTGFAAVRDGEYIRDAECLDCYNRKGKE